EFTKKLNANKISVAAEKITLAQTAQLDTAETAVFSNSDILLLKPGCSINSAGTIEQNGIGENQIAGKITAQKITLKTNTYIYNETEINAGTFTAGSSTTPADLADLYISALKGGIPAQVTFNAETHIFGNYALFNGKVTQNGNLSVEKDIILLNGNAAAMYKDANDGSSSSGVADLFKYTRRNGSAIAQNSLSAFPDKMPDGTAINHSGEYSSKFRGFSGKTISARQNFYDNGTALTPGGSWTLKLKPNDRAKDAFAELYNAEIAYCTVTATTSGTAWLSAAEKCTDGGNNTGIFFSRPEILVHNATNAKDTTGNANLSGTYTVYDNVIRVEFVDSITKQPLKIENSCNEISAALSTIEFGGTTPKNFVGAYTTAECTQSTDGQGDLSVFFLKTADSDKWNTDATGISKGADESTDWNGTHRTAIPYLNIPKALDSVWQTLRDEHKNRIAHYYTQTPQLSSENATSGATFTATADLCAPVLVAVRTGQELHAKNDGTAESQPFYDSHNFIELQYSEPVNTGNILLTSTGDENIQNIQVADNFGKIEGTSGNGITISGLIKTASGMLKTGSNGTEDNLVHSLYRKFSVTAGAEATFNTHRLRISIAGYVDKTVSTARGSFKHWKGYIDSAETPFGTVTRLYSSLISDKYGNIIETAGTNAHKLPGLSVISEPSELYGKWDTLAPVFAAYKNITNNEDTGFEAVATCSVDGTTLDRIEFHVFDNETNEPDWYIRTGWCNSSKSLFTPFSYAADIFGGARPFSTDKKVRTSGGLRYASLYNKSSSFSYKIDGGNPTSFSPDEITGGAKGLVFRTQSDVTNATGGEDGLYFAVYLADFSIPLKTTFEVTYNENGFVTDLAGNRMKTETITTIDRTPPAFNMSIGAVPDDSGNSYEELYVIFNKKLNTNSVTVYNNDGTTETKQFSEALRESLRFIDSSTKSPAQDISISTEKEVTVVFQNEYFTGLKIPLNRSLTYDDIKSLWIQAYTEKTSVDPLSGVKNANVTYIQDTLGNYLPYKSAHAISDFAVNIVNPIYAYDTRMTEDGTFFSQLMMHQDGSWAVHDWNAEQKNYGTLSAGYDLFIEVNLSDGSGEAPEDTTVFAYFDTMPDTQALSVTYNENISGTSLSSWRIWLPNYITDSSGTQESPVFKALSPQNNTMSKQTVLSGIKGEVPADAKTTGEIQFSLNTTTMENAGWKSGDQISFLFALSDGSNNPVKICHAPEYDSLTDTYTTEESPLFALRLKNIGDISSADLWSFKLQSITKQRGGVTIFNNVINASKGEKTVVQVNMPSGGTLNVIVMTLDGNIVKYLQHGETSQGNHNYTWDGTTKSGKKVARGLYFIRVFGNGIDETRKVMVVK
ncbi:FlgD immunoglobulin-like domain containing protein, partial [Treponema porcinum]|uniref:FlgD immunoglobulin-like domain containing protein n=1 Tax=Treponema porcinum TaxID=261392 RepID=UPI002A83DE8E